MGYPKDFVVPPESSTSPSLVVELPPSNEGPKGDNEAKAQESEQRVRATHVLKTEGPHTTTTAEMTEIKVTRNNVEIDYKKTSIDSFDKETGKETKKYYESESVVGPDGHRTLIGAKQKVVEEQHAINPQPHSEQPPVGSPAPLPTAEAEANRQAALKFWIKDGFTPAQAAGIVANEWQESSFNPKAIGDNGEAHGIAQWHQDRVDNIHQGTGIDVTTASHEEQLKAMKWELIQRGDYQAVKQQPTAKAAAACFCERFERPLDEKAEEEARGKLAQNLLPLAVQVQTGLMSGNTYPVQHYQTTAMSSVTPAPGNNSLPKGKETSDISH